MFPSPTFSMSIRSCSRLLSYISAPYSGFHSSEAVHLDNEENNLKSHQAKIMAQGLPKKKPISGVKDVFLVASGKGGVGKSTTAVNVASALKAINPSKEVGLLDADLFGPSIPLMMNLDDTPLLNEKNLMIPLQNYGVKCLSMGFLIEKNSPVIWRGLMVMQALDRLLRQAAWDHIDYLIIDTPPGTGDTHLSLLQNIPVSGVLLVTSPQKAAMQVTQRGANMFKKLNIPIIGIIQNMSSVQCPECRHKIPLHNDLESASMKDFDVAVLENIPLDNSISNGSDTGVPVVVSSPNGPQAMAYKNVANKIVEFLNIKEAN